MKHHRPITRVPMIAQVGADPGGGDAGEAADNDKQALMDFLNSFIRQFIEFQFIKTS